MKRYIAIDLQTAKQHQINLNDWALLENIHFMSNNDYGYCYASKQTLGDILQLSERTVFNMLTKLNDLDFIIKINTNGLKVTDKWIAIATGNTAKIAGTMQNVQSDTAKIAVGTLQKLHTKEDIKESNKRELRALDFLMKQSPLNYETFERNYKKDLTDFKKFVLDFNDKIDIEGLEFTVSKISARLNSYARNYIVNQNKFNKLEETNVIPIYRRKIS